MQTHQRSVSEGFLPSTTASLPCLGRIQPEPPAQPRARVSPGAGSNLERGFTVSRPGRSVRPNTVRPNRWD